MPRKKKPAPVAPPVEKVRVPRAESLHNGGRNLLPLVQQVTCKTTLRPRLIEPRWASVAEFGGMFSGDIALGNGTIFRIVCGFTANRHFFLGVLGEFCWLFPAGQKTIPADVMTFFALPWGDCKNLSDFINSQLDGMDPVEYQGEYIRAHCA